MTVIGGCGERPLEPRDPTPGVPHFTLMTYNVENNSSDESDTLAAVGEPDADIVCIQEATPSWETRLREEYGARYPHMIFHVVNDDTARGLAMLSRFPLTDLGIIPGPNDWHPAWHLLVETPAGTLQVLNIHLRSLFDSGTGTIDAYLSVDEDHLYEIKLFTEECDADLPTVIAGDFNEAPDGPAIGYLEDRGYRNALPLFRPGQGTWRHASLAGQFAEAIDHILFSDALEPLNAWVHTAGSSDHLPVIAHFEAAYHWNAAATP